LSLEQAGRWFLESGIQEPGGGVARYYRSDSCANAPVSAEITGYAASALAYLHARTGEARYLEAARCAAGYLAREAWDPAACAYPFEPGSDRAYFFDTGIMVRGLLAVWRSTGDEEFHTRAHEAALSMAFDFLGGDPFHAIITLPEKQPVAAEAAWSRSPGCYQLKAALAWQDPADEYSTRLFETVLAHTLRTHAPFLSAESDRAKLMDRLHAYCYFLEGLLAVADRAEVRAVLSAGIDRVAVLLRQIAPEFERCDVLAQLLRIRLAAHHAGAVALDETAAGEEAGRTAAYRIQDSDRRLHGGFWFGRKQGKILPFANPVSTAFAMQALALWEDHRAGRWDFTVDQLI
jgi:hypothetical protein